MMGFKGGGKAFSKFNRNNEVSGDISKKNSLLLKALLHMILNL
jgi:hypothetical protein